MATNAGRSATIGESWDVERMRPLAEAWDRRMRQDVSRFDRLVPETAARGSLLRDPARAEEVIAAEERLSVRLPPSYRAFLLLTNGAEASLSADTEGGNRSGLLRVEEIAPMVEVDEFIVEMWTGMEEFADPAMDTPPTGLEPATVRYYPPVRSGLAISERAQNQRVALVPRAGHEEWELWWFEWEGAYALPSFASFLRFLVDLPDARPKPELEDPRAGELACEVLLDTSIPEVIRGRAAHALRLLADPRFLPYLHQAFADATTMLGEVLGALQACGDHSLDDEFEARVQAERDAQCGRSG